MATHFYSIIIAVCTEIPRFTSLIRFSETARKAKTRKTKMNFPKLPDGKNDRYARRSCFSEN
jgi:hypothetical protein